MTSSPTSSAAPVSQTRRPLPDTTVALPALALLERAALTDALHHSLDGVAPVSDARVTYLEYAPTRLVLHVQASVDGSLRQAVARAGRAVTVPVRRTGRHLPAHDAVVHWLPADPALPLLQATDDQLTALMREAGLPAQRNGSADPPMTAGVPTVLAYVPGRRATLQHGPYVLKGYATQNAFDTARRAMLLLGDGQDLPTPLGLASLPRQRTTVQEHVSGAPAARHDVTALAAESGVLLRHLHGSARTAAVRRDPLTQLRDARAPTRVLATVLPGEGARAAALVRRLAASAPAGLPTVLSHGDFTIDQLLVDANGDIVVTDVDNACQAPAAYDLATFAANLVSGRPDDEAVAESALAALIASYGDPPGLRWHYAVALLRRCDRPFRRLKKRWPEKSMAILDLAERASTS